MSRTRREDATPASAIGYPEFLAKGAGACAADKLPPGVLLDDFTTTGLRRDAMEARQRAKAVCRTCPHVVECLVWALETQEPSSVLGGFTAAERRRYGRALLGWVEVIDHDAAPSAPVVDLPGRPGPRPIRAAADAA